jgi:hypothetical protein
VIQISYVLIGKYRCEVEWSNEKEPLQVTHHLKVLVAPSVKFIPSTKASQLPNGYTKKGTLFTKFFIKLKHIYISMFFDI